jgi:large subunit ribosomal protein L5
VSGQLKARYTAEAIPALQKQFGYVNSMQVPRVDKIVINIGLGEALTNAKAVDAAVGDLQLITGQKPIVTRAKRSIAQFRVRTGNPIGVKVTLRGERMWDFLERLTRLALPRIRDFRGVPGKSFDGRGNYSLGLREQLAFPEIDYDKVDRLRGLRPTRSRSVCSNSSACPSPARAGRSPDGQEVHDREGQAGAEAPGAGVSPLLRVRPAAGVHAPLRAVPYLLPRARARRRAARRHEVELVGR